MHGGPSLVCPPIGRAREEFEAHGRKLARLRLFTFQTTVPQQMTEEDVREAVVAYLAAHPDAIGTLEAITEWCAAHPRVGVDGESVRRAVRQLAETGVLEEVKRGRDRRYRLSGTRHLGTKRPE